MSLLKNLSKIIEINGRPSSEEFQKRLTPENTLDELKDFNSNPRILAGAEKTAGEYGSEWFLNSFQYASYEVAEKDIVSMAHYINISDVFNLVAPQFYGNTSWNHVVRNLFNRCPPEDSLALLNTLESNGHMQGMMRERHLGCEAVYVYFENATAGLSVEDSIRALKHSPSFAIVKQDQNFRTAVLEDWPEYKSLLD
ncbi:MAG: hypothetical protein COC19_08275 [SAR86 cluster bacterium]|uniref:Uncharacterized protein n=1 Tax=SAR86 cluster bacterium TaxID=2030880 RepID=A0A2A4MG33_9GAMM|nr:MAG: hypothetical protein COC19_08275 [SAR86 cluster bacterium]